jgi:hypothetical protein
MKFIKFNIYNKNHCYKDCRDFYSTLLSKCITDIKVEKENVSSFYPDFKTILSKQKVIELQLYNLTETNKVTIDVESDLNILVAYGLKLNSNLDDYFTNKVSTLNTVSKNLLDQSLKYLQDVSISGFTESEKIVNLSKPYFSPVNVVLIIEAVLFIILIVAFTYLICSLYSLESFYLKRLIKFKNPPFDSYLKNLEEIKKKNNKNEGEEEDKFKDEIDAQEFNNSKRSKKDEDIEKDNKKGKKKKKDSDDERGAKSDKEDKEKKGGPKRKQHKKPVKNYQEDKMNIMGKFFLYWNILFCIKVLAIFLLSVSYYLIVTIIDGSTRNSLLDFDSTSNNIEGVFKSSFDIYLSLKTELAKYVDYEIKKQELANYLDNNPNTKVIFEGLVYSSSADLLNSDYKYNMNLPNQIETPKIGSLLMPLINTDLNTASDAVIKLNNLYNVNSCEVLFDKKIQIDDYNYCSNFWSSILLKGMEQSITQMSVVVTTVLDDLHSLNMKKKSLQNIIAPTSPFGGYELFVEFYLFKSYMQTVEIFRSLNQDNLLKIYDIYKAIMIGYICFVLILFCLLLYFVYRSKNIFNTFMNFIGILPAKFLVEDPGLYKEILKLEQYIYY